MGGIIPAAALRPIKSELYTDSALALMHFLGRIVVFARFRRLARVPMMTDDEHKAEETDSEDSEVSDDALDEVFDAEDEDEELEDADKDDKSAFGDDGEGWE
jgi:phosphopantothenoylcysteine synthetase/decarboxylase